MEYITVQQAAEKWNVTERWVQALLKRGSIDGAARFGKAWMVPKDAQKPADGRVRNGRKPGAGKKTSEGQLHERTDI